MGYLYRHIRLDKNEVFYIGIGGFDKRESKNSYTRAYSNRNRNKHWHGISNLSDFVVEIILDGLSKEESIKKEIEFIKIYGRKDLGLGTLANMTDGGDGHKTFSEESISKIRESRIGKHHSEDTKLKISQKKKGLKIHTDEYKSEVGERMKGNKYRLGMTMSQYNKDMIIKSWKGKKHTEDTKMKISQSKVGKKVSDEVRIRLKGLRKGYKHTDETKEKLSLFHTERYSKPDVIMHSSKLTPDQVIIIKTIEFNIDNKELSIKYDVSEKTIDRIKKGKTWKHIII